MIARKRKIVIVPPALRDNLTPDFPRFECLFKSIEVPPPFYENLESAFLITIHVTSIIANNTTAIADA